MHDSAITVQQVDGLKGMMSNPICTHQQVSLVRHMYWHRVPVCITVYLYHPAPVNEPVPFPPSGCACLTIHPSIYILIRWWALSMLTYCLHVTLPISCSSTEHLHACTPSTTNFFLVLHLPHLCSTPFTSKTFYFEVPQWPHQGVLWVSQWIL